MKFINLVLSLILIGIVLSAKPKVTIYAESYCPDCVEFESTAFAKFVNNPSKELLADVELIVFGNASESKSDSGYSYKCQHGEKECRGNLVSSCVQKVLNSDLAEKRLVCVAQSMQRQWGDVESKVYNCLESIEEKTLVEDCVKNQSAEVMHDIASRTGSHKYVPWVILDGVHNDDIQHAFEDDMVGYLCKLNNLVGKVEGCPSKAYRGKCYNFEESSDNGLKFLN